MPPKKRLSDQVADDIMNRIVSERQFAPGEKLPNENELSEALGVSRTTLREAIRILATNGVLEIVRGRGTFVRADIDPAQMDPLQPLCGARADIRDLYEMRLLFEPAAAALAAERATDGELAHILALGKQIEEKIRAGEDRTEAEQAFHRAIAKATHNEWMNKLMPVLYRAIDTGVSLSRENDLVVLDTIADHRLIVEFMAAHNPQGAKNAMEIHILHAMQKLGIE